MDTYRRYRTFALIAAWVSIGLLAACGSKRPDADVGSIYSEAARSEVRNPVIVIHGILGARLMQRSTQSVVWGAFTKEGLDPNDPDGARAIAVPLDVPTSASAYDPSALDVYASGPLDKLELTFLFNVLSVDVYANILRTLGAGGYADNVKVDPESPAYSEDHYTCFSFFYDWRRDNIENAIRFGDFLKATRRKIAASAPLHIAKLRATGNPRDAEEADQVQAWLDRGYRFDVVAHSMGGLIARYFLRYGAEDLPASGEPEVTWRGADEIDRLIIVGTPSFGSLFALDRLTRGFKVAFFLPEYGPALLGTMPSIYQLLPRDRHNPLLDADGKPSDLSLFDVDVWKRNRWGLFAPEARRDIDWILAESPADERAQRVEDYVAWSLDRAARLHRALDKKPERPSPAEIFLFAGDVLPTPSRVRLTQSEDGRLLPDFDHGVEHEPGDTTVPRYSALADERHRAPGLYRRLESPILWNSVTFVADDHVGLTSNPAFSNNSLHILLERPLLREPPGPR